MVVPENRWFEVENPINNGGFGGTPTSGNHNIAINCYLTSATYICHSAILIVTHSKCHNYFRGQYEYSSKKKSGIANLSRGMA